MASAADRFTRLEKLAIFLIALGEQRTREILADVDIDTLQHLNGAIAALGTVTSEEKAAVMLEFAHFFYADEPISDPLAPGKAKPSASRAGRKMPGPRVSPTQKSSKKSPGQLPADKSDTLDLSGKKPDLNDEEQAILHTLDKLRRKVDPGQIDWGKAGYDFGDGFKGTDDSRH